MASLRQLVRVMTKLPLQRLRPMLFVTVALLTGCSTFAPAVTTRALTPGEYLALKRGDVLTTGKLSAATRETINVAGLLDTRCVDDIPTCAGALSISGGVSEERRQSALAELWAARALLLQSQGAAGRGDSLFDAWMETARRSYVYLFFTERVGSDRAFEERQTQVRDYYNLATQEGAKLLFDRVKDTARTSPLEALSVGQWHVRIDMTGMRFPGNAERPRELVPAASLSFAGLRSVYRRDGLGAELVAVTPSSPTPTHAVGPSLIFGDDPQSSQWGNGEWSEMDSPVISVLTHFPGDDLEKISSTREVMLSVHDPYRDASVQVGGQAVPLAANFSAGYGLWLARSGFSRQSLRNLLGREDSIERPHLYLMQPFDPDRRIIVMLHGLASSPEAWANVANELMGDEALRQHFQIWQVYYSTNIPIVFNHYAIRQTLLSVLSSFDPPGTSAAANDMVLVGHSMGGVISRLMVSSSEETLVEMAREDHGLDDAGVQRAIDSLGPALRFNPLPNVERVVFLAAPHRGTSVAGGWLVRQLSALVRLPLTLTEGAARLVQGMRPNNGNVLTNSVQNLDKADPFIVAAARLPPSKQVKYHSIIARRDGNKPLDQSDDGLVPYWSSHMPGAASEKIVASGHSVQETAAAIIELRRILHEDIQERPPLRPARGRR
jgi:triacylglycerol esterase/lipase EstA (alpha/beta hydrolase family)